MEKTHLSFADRFSLWVEDLLMTRWVPKDRPGPIFKWLFKIPILFYRVGLPLFGNFILLLTHTGRISGKPRYTPLEYHKEEGSGFPIVMAGWGGNTDWRKNIQKNPKVKVQMGRRKVDAIAEPLQADEIASWLSEAIKINPNSVRLWSRWAGEEVSNENRDSLLRAAKYFPCYRLRLSENE